MIGLDIQKEKKTNKEKKENDKKTTIIWTKMAVKVVTTVSHQKEECFVA